MNRTSERCLICGRRHRGRCSRRSLAAIDAANRRALDAEDSPDDNLGHPGGQPSIGQRLADGFRWMHAIADAD